MRNKYRIRCGDLYYCGMAYEEGRSYERWEKESCFTNPLEMNLTDVVRTFVTLLETGKYTEMLIIEKVEE